MPVTEFVTEVRPDDAALRAARRARVLAEMEAADVDLPRPRAGGATPATSPACPASGPPGPAVRPRLRARAGDRRRPPAQHLGRGHPRRHPARAPATAITFNSMNFVTVLKGIEGAATARTVATDVSRPATAHLLPMAFPAAELIDGEADAAALRTVKMPDEIDAIRGAVRVAERRWPPPRPRSRPGITERQLTGVFMEAMAAPASRPRATQDVAGSPPRTLVAFVADTAVREATSSRSTPAWSPAATPASSAGPHSSVRDGPRSTVGWRGGGTTCGSGCSTACRARRPAQRPPRGVRRRPAWRPPRCR